MFLRLLLPQEPVIHVSLSFEDLPQNINTPLAWANQLNHLAVEELEIPNNVHSLDKAAGITSLLEEVVFDVRCQEVRCKFADGGTEEWGFHDSGGQRKTGVDVEREGRKLLAVLEGIAKDVRSSTEEEERAMLEKEKERQRVVRLERSNSVTIKRANSKVLKHKKQRSMFMQIVSSIGSTIANLTSSSLSVSRSSRPSTSLSTSAVITDLGQDNPSQPSPAGHPKMTPKARALRRAARTALVDAYRRFVLSELTQRLPGFSYRDADGNYLGVHSGGFCVWILHSMRRRAQERIDQIFEEAQAVMAEQAHICLSEDEDQQVLEQVSGEQVQPQSEQEPLGNSDFSPMTVIPPSFDEDEDETATETDGSSLHTPSTGSHLNYFLVPPLTTASSYLQAPSSSDMGAECQQSVQECEPSFPTTPSPPSSPTPPTSPTSPTFLNLPSSPCSESIPSSVPAFPSRPTSSTLSQNLSGAALAEYNKLIDIRERLWQLAMFADSQNRIAAEEVRNRLEVLTVRSRRRAWSAGEFRIGCGNRARNCQANVAFALQTQYGFSVPFRSSPLARFSWTAEDLEKENEKELEAASSDSLISAVAGFPSYLRPFSLAEGEIESIDAIHLEGGDAEDSRSLVDGEFDLYEEFPGPSPLDLRGRRGKRYHRRRKDILEMGVSGGSAHKLFPVSEELEGEGEEAVDLEFRVALGGGIDRYGTVRGRRMDRRGRTFMGCDEVAVEGDEDEAGLGHSRETLVDEMDDGLVDPRELDIELGFGFDFHQKGGGTGFLGHADDDVLFDEDDEDEDEFKFDLSSQLERPKIRPRMRTSSIFMPRDVIGQPSLTTGARTAEFHSQPIDFSSSSYHLPKYTPLSKSAPAGFPSRSMRSAAYPVSANYPVLDISRTAAPCEPEVAEIEIRLVDEQPAGPYSSTRLSNSQGQNSTDLWRAATNAHMMKALPAAPLPIPVLLEIGVQDDGPEEFTLAMDLPRAVAGGANAAPGGSPGKKWMRSTPTAKLVWHV